MDENVFEYYNEREQDTMQMAESQLEEQENLDAEEENRDLALICWENLSTDDARCKTITGFTCEEFLQLYEQCESVISENIGRGRSSRFSKQDKFLMTLCYVKHYETVDKMKETFCVSAPRLHTILQEMIQAITPVLYTEYVDKIQTHLEEVELPEVFPESLFVMDVKFQEIWTPLGTFNERKRYFSGKHKAYGLKSQCLHNRQGFVLHCVSGIPGAVHDLTIARQNIDEVFLQISILTS